VADTLPTLSQNLANTLPTLGQHYCHISFALGNVFEMIAVWAVPSRYQHMGIKAIDSSFVTPVGKSKRLGDGCHFSKKRLTIHIYHQQSTDMLATVDHNITVEVSATCWLTYWPSVDQQWRTALGRLLVDTSTSSVKRYLTDRLMPYTRSQRSCKSQQDRVFLPLGGSLEGLKSIHLPRFGIRVFLS